MNKSVPDSRSHRDHSPSARTEATRLRGMEARWWTVLFAATMDWVFRDFGRFLHDS